MRPIIWLLSLFILLVVQAGILQPLHLAPVNLILVLIVAATLMAEFKLALGLTITGGLLLDFVSGTPDGLTTMSLLAVFLLLYFVVNTFVQREPNQFILFASVAASTLVYFVFFLVLNWLFGFVGLGSQLDMKFILSHDLPLTLLLNLLLTYPVFIYYSWTHKWAIRFKSQI